MKTRLEEMSEEDFDWEAFLRSLESLPAEPELESRTRKSQSTTTASKPERAETADETLQRLEAKLPNEGKKTTQHGSSLSSQEYVRRRILSKDYGATIFILCLVTLVISGVMGGIVMVATMVCARDEGIPLLQNKGEVGLRIGSILAALIVSLLGNGVFIGIIIGLLFYYTTKLFELTER